MAESAPTITGDSVTDFVLEAGPRVFGPDVPAHVREEIATSPALQWYRDALIGMGQTQVAWMHREIENTSRENREIENSQEFKSANGLGYPEARIPLSVHIFFEGIYGFGCWKQEDFRQDFLKHHPGLRIKVTRGTRGQEYAGRKLKAETRKADMKTTATPFWMRDRGYASASDSSLVTGHSSLSK